MTQQPYYPPQPPVPQPAYAPPAPQYAPAPAYVPAPQGYPAPAAPPVPLATGTIADFYAQPSAGGGPSISWKGKPDGTTYAGIVSGPCSVQQDTDPVTKAPKTYRDGRPKFSMRVPLKVQASAEFPEGEAVLWVRGQLRDELSRAQSEAGVMPDAPAVGSAVQVTLVQRKPTNSGIPANVFRVHYTPAPGEVGQSPAAAPAVAAPSPVAAPVVQQQVAAPAPAPVPQAAAPAPAAVPPAAQAVAAPAPPSDLSPKQQALLAQLTGAQG